MSVRNMSRTDGIDGLALRVSLRAILTLMRALQELPFSEPTPGPGDRDEECVTPSLGVWCDMVRWGAASLATAIVGAEKGVRLLAVDEGESGRVLLDALRLMRFVGKVPLAVLAAWECEYADCDAA